MADLPTTYEMPEEPTLWIERMLQYTVAGGKMNRGLAAMACQATLAESQGKTLSDRQRCQAAALGWCIEFLQAFFLVCVSCVCPVWVLCGSCVCPVWVLCACEHLS